MVLLSFGWPWAFSSVIRVAFRAYDVGVFSRLSRFWYGRVGRPPKNLAHLTMSPSERRYRGFLMARKESLLRVNSLVQSGS
jgi:hypothetical protein